MKERFPDVRSLAEAVAIAEWTLIHWQLWGVREMIPRVPPGPRKGSSRKESLEDIRKDLGSCTRCRLHRGRTHLVFGEGNTRAAVVFVGEGPGYDEDKQGRPFVGRAGKLLDKMIQAMDMTRSDVYICNVVKCRPPGNRTPESQEIEACSPFLFRQLEALRPRVICTLGACATQTLLKTSKPISKLRNRVHFWRGIPVIATYHPAYLLRNPAAKASSWKDLVAILNLMDSEV